MLKGLKESAVRMGVSAVLLVTLVIAVGCGSSPKEVSVGASDNGRQVELQKGQTLIVDLESNPSTGYSWEVAELEKSILQQVGEAEFKPGSRELVGAPGTEIFHFQAMKAGQTALKLIYHRPWEEGVEPLQTFSLQIVVR